MDREEYLILQKLRNSEVEALDMLYIRYAGRIKEFSFLLLHSRTEAEDLTHDIFVKLWEQREGLDKIVSLNGYLFRMTRNSILNIIRRRAVQVRYESSVNERLASEITPPHAELPDTLVSTAELSEMVEAAVGNMSERRRTIFMMSRHDYKSYEEIAAELQISPKTVQYHISGALSELRKLLAV